MGVGGGDQERATRSHIYIYTHNMACSFCEALQECQVCADDMPEGFLAICKELEVSSYGDTFRPDFAG